MKKNLIVLQEGNKDCGSAALLSIIRYYGGDISIDRLIELTKTTKDGTNFYNISEASSKLGLEARGYKVDDVNKIKDIHSPFIAQLNNKNYTHFIVVYKIFDGNVLIMDPAKGKCTLDMFDFCNLWTGYIMLFEKVKNLPYYKDEKILNKIIINVLFNNKGIILSLVVLSIIFTVFSCLASLYSKIVFDKVIDTNLNNLIIISFMFSILYLIKNITSFIRNHLIIYLNQKLDVSIFLSSFSKIILLPYMYYKNKTTSEVLSRIIDLSYIKTFISKLIVTVFLDFLLFVISLVVVYNINKKITLTIILVSLLYLIIILIFNKPVKTTTKLNQENSEKVNNIIIESVNSYETVKGLNIEDNIILKFSKIYSKSLNTQFYTEKMNNIILILKEITSDLGTLLISFIGIKLVMNNNLTIGDYMTITFFTSYIIYPIKNLIDLTNNYHYTKSSLKRANNLLEIEEEKIYDSKKLNVTGDIIIKNLSYTYNNKYYVLNNLNLYIKEKEKVLILGSSGSGKSTILKLLYKYYPVSRDKIFIGNYDIEDYSFSDIRKEILYISQNEFVFTDSIRNNILLGREVDEQKYLDICKMTYIDDIVKDNILGYDYLLEENGVNISGGQRQRIILARGLLKNSNIIMIDEGFSQIDINLERKILKNIFNYFAHKTIIIISHRHNNMDLYDRMVEIESGFLKSNLIRGEK